VAGRGEEIGRAVRATLSAVKDARTALSPLEAEVFREGRAAIERQLARLLAPGWLRTTPASVLAQLPKYARAAARRAERLRGDVERDRRLEAQVAPYERAWRTLVERVAPERPGAETMRLGWMIEEFRLSLHAQDLRTLGPVSAQRLDAQLERARAEAGR
jgi:ATP-dependent helicase HrpA